MLDLDCHVTLRRERARERLVDVENRSGGDPELLESLEPVRSRVGSQVAFDGALELTSRRLPEGVAGESRILGELRRANGFAEPHELGGAQATSR